MLSTKLFQLFLQYIWNKLQLRPKIIMVKSSFKFQLSFSYTDAGSFTTDNNFFFTLTVKIFFYFFAYHIFYITCVFALLNFKCITVQFYKLPWPVFRYEVSLVHFLTWYGFTKVNCITLVWYRFRVRVRVVVKMLCCAKYCYRKLKNKLKSTCSRTFYTYLTHQIL